MAAAQAGQEVIAVVLEPDYEERFRYFLPEQPEEDFRTAVAWKVVIAVAIPNA